MDDSTIICDEITEVKETNFNKRSNLKNATFLYFTSIFINCNINYLLIDSC